MLNLMLTLAVLVPGLELHEQPYLSDAFTARAAVVDELQQAMDEADAAVQQLLAEQAEAEAARQAEAEAARQAELLEQQQVVVADTPWPWGALADCESGEWDANANPIPGSRRWDYGAPGAFSRPGYDFDGGLNFAASTWTWVAPMVGLGHITYAYEATPQEQVRVGEKVLELQGWSAWPICSRKLGLR